jgi:serine/threonine protein kinase
VKSGAQQTSFSPVAVCPSCRSVIEKSASFCPFCGSAQPAVAPAPRIGPGSHVDLGWGKVVVGSPIGEGGMGVVFRGWLYYDPRGSQAGTPAHPVALKALHPMLKGRQRARQLFLSEATALARLSHPNIVHFFALTQNEGQLAIAMEIVEGQPLSEVIDRHAHQRPCLPFVRAWHYFSQLLGALAAIHAMGIIHRDVKPSNVIVRHDGVIKLTDFGIARVPADAARDTGGMAPGTGAYMAPEQVLGREIDARADLYSAAIVLYEMLSGRTPFDAPDRNEVMVRTAQVEEPPAPISQHVAGAPEVLDVLMARALAKDPMHRFGSAIELGEAFRTSLGLEQSAGWEAQQELAESAQAISQYGMEGKEPPQPIEPEQAEKLRTDVMVAYQE